MAAAVTGEEPQASHGTRSAAAEDLRAGVSGQATSRGRHGGSTRMGSAWRWGRQDESCSTLTAVMGEGPQASRGTGAAASEVAGRALEQGWRRPFVQQLW